MAHALSRFDCGAATAEAAALLKRYYAKDDVGRPRYMGSQFEAIAAVNAKPHSVGLADFTAVRHREVPDDQLGHPYDGGTGTGAKDSYRVQVKPKPAVCANLDCEWAWTPQAGECS